MKQVSKKYLKSLGVEDITNADDNRLKKLKKRTEMIAISRGINGMTGGLFKDIYNGDLYVITARSSSLFYMY